MLKKSRIEDGEKNEKKREKGYLYRFFLKKMKRRGSK